MGLAILLVNALLLPSLSCKVLGDLYRVERREGQLMAWATEPRRLRLRPGVDPDFAHPALLAKGSNLTSNGSQA